jgi:uncharacterized membrane protein
MLALDALRGLAMVVMALDHANHFVAHGKLAPELWSGPFPDYRGDALAFVTRAVTHLAAPGFFFTMGAGMALLAAVRREQGWSARRIVGHLLVRGALLIAFQFLLENPAWRMGGMPGSTTYFGVLYALGGAMIIGSLLLWLPAPWLAALGALLVVLTELLLPDPGRASGPYAPILHAWLIPGYTRSIYVLYPLMPWLGVTGLGMAYGRWLGRDRAGAYRAALGLGLIALLLFGPLRLLGGLGNVRPAQGSNWIDLLNVVKYPPSLAFLLLTLGADLTLLGLFGRASGAGRAVLWPLAVLGRAPLFFYVTHLYLYALMGHWIDPRGVGIPRMFPYWLLGLAILFPLCWLYGRFKHSRSPDSLWRFF